MAYAGYSEGVVQQRMAGISGGLFFKYWHEAYISEVKGPEQLTIMFICHRNND